MPDENAPTEAGEPTASPSRPNAKFSGSGGITAAVWKQKTDAGIEHYSVRLERRYKDDNGGFQSTPYLREGDLLRAQKILGQVDDWIEQDRAKHRGMASQDRTGRE